MAGSQDDIPPPPPPSQTPTQQQNPHTVSTIKLHILKKGEYDIWAMKMEHYLAHTDYLIWEDIQNGNGPVSIFTDTEVNTARASGTNNVSTARHNFNRHVVPTNAAMKVNIVKPIVNRVRPANLVLLGEKGKLLLSPQQVVIGDKKDITGKISPNTIVDQDYPHKALKHKGIVDSGCSRHMTGNKAYLAAYQDFNGGPVAFGGSKGYITGKGKIKTGKLDFKDVCFVKELQHFNLFSVSQIYDKKNKVLFTDSECLVLSPEFKLPDDNQVLLSIPTHNNMYSFNLENIVPSGGLDCLIAKATIDESNKWHRRLGHVNFKNLNKLVKGNLDANDAAKLIRSSTASPSGELSFTHLTNTDQDDSEIPALKEIYNNPTDGIFTNASYDDEGAVADFTNLETIVNVSPIPTSRINSIHPSTLILGDPKSAQRRNNHKDFQHCLFACFLSQNEPKKISKELEDESWVDDMQEELLNKKDKRGVVVRNKARLVAQGHRQEEGIDYDEVLDPIARIEAIRIFLAFASYMGFIVNQMDVKSAFLYGKIDEKVYVSQPLGFIDPKYPKKVYKVVKALYGLHQAPRAWQNPSWAFKYPRVYSFSLEAYSDSDYAGTNLTRNPHRRCDSFLAGDIFLGQCKKQTIRLLSTIEEEDGAAKGAANFGKPVTISEASIQSDLRFDDADGIDSLNNQAILDAIKLMGHLDATKKFVMYPRFISIFFSNQLKNVPVPLDHFSIHALSNKVFSFMDKKGKHFSRKVTPLFPNMLVQPTEDEGEGSERPSEPQPTPSPPHPSEAHVEPQSNQSPGPSPTIPIPDPIPEGSGGTLRSQSSTDNDSLKTVQRMNQNKKKVLKTSKRRSVFKQGRKTVKSSKGAPTVPTNTEWDDLDMDIDDTMDYTLAQDEGKTDKVDEKGESTARKQSTDRQDEGTNMPKASTARTKLSTDKVEEGTVEPEPRESTFLAAQTTPTPTLTTFRDDETIAQIDPKDKGKKRIEEDEESNTESKEITKAKKKFDHIAHDEEVARKIQEEWEAEKERKRLNEEEATKTAHPPNQYDFSQARIEADRLSSKINERKIKEMNEGASDPDKKKKLVKEDVSAKVPAKQDVAEQGTKKRKLCHMKMIAIKRKRTTTSMLICDDEHKRVVKIVTFNEVNSGNDQQDWEIVTWRLYEACGVCILEFRDGTVIHMLVERKYPLSKKLLQRMLIFD
ncbi:putative ribonuclease H-like domain-containing protein [Tanacetum coccineum]|uniref:Ribonuclease H-like domain-containing protein n=1 Tax=Tanacetum coccineum TaxID=301880 RepID=A0ABQ5G910_9ASTR